MPVVVWEAARPKGRPPRWAFRVTADAGVVFESAWVAVRFAARHDSEWLAATIDRLAAPGGSPAAPATPASASRCYGGAATSAPTTGHRRRHPLPRRAHVRPGPGRRVVLSGASRHRAVLPHRRVWRAAAE